MIKNCAGAQSTSRCFYKGYSDKYDWTLTPHDLQMYQNSMKPCVNNDASWHFYHSSYPMSNTKELDMLTDQAGCDLPEVFYGKNKFIALMPSKDLIIEICPVEAVSLTSF